MPSEPSEPSEEPLAEPTTTAEPVTPLRRAKRFAPLLLLAGVFAMASMVLPHVPRERHIALRVADPATVTAVELGWTPHGDGEAVLGGTWHFKAGEAPGAVETTVSLPDGRYELDVTIERSESRAVHHRTLTVADADRITVPIP